MSVKRRCKDEKAMYTLRDGISEGQRGAKIS
jgi:hypothetical protein